MTNETLNKIRIYGWRITGILGLAIAPFVSYWMFEYVTGNLSTVAWYMAALNIAWMYVLYLIVFAVFGTTRIAIPVVSAAFFIVSVAEAFVVSFRGRPIMLWDVLALRTALTVSENYTFVITRQMKLAFLALVIFNLCLWFAPVRLKGLKLRLGFGAGVVAASAGYALWFFASLAPGWGLGINMWAVNTTYQEYGYVLSTAVSLKYVVRKAPEGYGTARLKEIYEEYAGRDDFVAQDTEQFLVQGEGDAVGDAAEITPVNLICIMNESLAELKVAGDYTTNMEYFPFINSLVENTVKGSLCVPVFGSMTSNTEFEFLTGDSMALLPSNSIAYQFNVKPGAFSMVSTLKDQGYKAVAMHPYPGENWNRVEVYRNLGFDEFLDQEYYEGCGELRNYVSDRADYDQLIRMVEEKENPSDPLFIFNVTMQNHGGYEGIYDNFEQEVRLTGAYEGKYPKTDQYLSLMKKSDEAFEYLLSYFSGVKEPTMIVMFGDHQPSVEDEFYDDIAGMPSAQVPQPDHLMWYETPFIIWTNYDMPSAQMDKLGAVYLSSEVLYRANLSLTPYNQFLLSMEQLLPVIHPLGCFDAEGDYYTWAEAGASGSPYEKTIHDYEALVYNHSLDRKKYREMFTVK